MGVVFVTGVLVGMVIILLISMLHLVGTLRVDESDPDEAYIFLELDKRLSDITSKKYVILRIKQENFIPHQ